MKDKELIAHHSRMDRPVPGEGMLTDPANPMPWESPPRFSSVIQASEYIFGQFVDEDLNPVILDAMEDGIPIMDITRFILFKGFTDGLWNPDLLLLLVEPTAYILLALAERALIDPLIYHEEDQDDISEEMQTFTDNEALADLKNYSPEAGIPEGALSESITKKIEKLPKGRKSLLEKPSLLERTA
tara:strand:+ start:136 stop:693 length:558 start_codon:yes stop_codon:yes gene_type:complete